MKERSLIHVHTINGNTQLRPSIYFLRHTFRVRKKTEFLFTRYLNSGDHLVGVEHDMKRIMKDRSISFRHFIFKYRHALTHVPYGERTPNVRY